MNTNYKFKSLPALGLGTILVANICLFVPFALYVGNINEFTVSFLDISSQLVPPTLLTIGTLGLVGIILPDKYYRSYIVILAATSLLLWLQGNILVWDYGALDGSIIDWSIDPWRGWADLGIWLAVISMALFFQKRLSKPIIYIAIIVFALQTIVALAIGFQNSSKLIEKSASRPQGDTLRELYKFSIKRNVLHLVLDGMQSDVFLEIINNKGDGKQLATELTGFTLFKDHLGVFPFTHMSVPALLSSKIYYNHMPKDIFLEQVISGNTILNTAYNAGFEIDVASKTGLTSLYTKGRYTNRYTIPTNNHISEQDLALEEAAKLLDLSLFRLAPHFLKNYIYNDQLWFIQDLYDDAGYNRLEFFAHNRFLLQLTENMSVDRTVPVYKLMHLMLSHKPMVTNRHCQYAGRLLPVIRSTVYNQSKCALKNVAKLLNRLKELGIYDDTLIVLMADHGAWINPTGVVTERQIPGIKNPKDFPTMVAMALPLMAIKPPGASGPLRISTAPTSIIDTPKTIASILGLPDKFDGASAFDLQPDQIRQRRHYIYEYQKSDWTQKTQYLKPILEYVIEKSPFRSDDWHPAYIYYPKGVVGRNK